jgi:ubiquinone/menaquinone biosynthesis C-methylase UbiE
MRKQNRQSRSLHFIALAVAIALAPSWSWAEDREQWQQPDRVMADLHLPAGTQVADIGCGGGYFTFRFARATGPSGKVFAVDVSADVLKSVRERVQRERLENIEVVQSAATDTRLPAESLDVAFFCEVLHEMPAADRLLLIRDVVRALKPGGILILIDWRKSHDITFDPYEKLIPREDLVQLGTDAGLALDAEFHYLKYQVFLRFRKPGARS